MGDQTGSDLVAEVMGEVKAKEETPGTTEKVDNITESDGTPEPTEPTATEPAAIEPAATEPAATELKEMETIEHGDTTSPTEVEEPKAEHDNVEQKLLPEENNEKVANGEATEAAKTQLLKETAATLTA